ncbi:hypothetical protein PIROE2DRAFT_60371 [Piromyces sp. E2]|nr:hypothetical protein PIROE2DRAFT_60371 [Piromyces sp. E2]|eukprot:OUM64898.1 hypothetical protein PIROE2DRAFT_60371 [Piromyces sp. E2]
MQLNKKTENQISKTEKGEIKKVTDYERTIKTYNDGSVEFGDWKKVNEKEYPLNNNNDALSSLFQLLQNIINSRLITSFSNSYKKSLTDFSNGSSISGKLRLPKGFGDNNYTKIIYDQKTNRIASLYSADRSACYVDLPQGDWNLIDTYYGNDPVYNYNVNLCNKSVITILSIPSVGVNTLTGVKAALIELDKCNISFNDKKANYKKRLITSFSTSYNSKNLSDFSNGSSISGKLYLPRGYGKNNYTRIIFDKKTNRIAFLYSTGNGACHVCLPSGDWKLIDTYYGNESVYNYNINLCDKNGNIVLSIPNVGIHASCGVSAALIELEKCDIAFN